MAVVKPSLPRRLLGPVERLYEALIDPARADRCVGYLLVAFTAIYTAYAVVSTSSTDVHWDVGELVAWSREPAWGYKHPPLSAWTALVWFSVFPLTDWSAYLLAMVVSASAIWVAWRLSGDWLDAERRVLGLAMVMLIPLYTFHAIKFNANTVMMPMWAAATLFFLRSVVLRNPASSALAGAFGAGALLGKYWSLNLVAGLGLAGLLDRRRAAYFRSSAPWITLGCMTVVLLPHLLWMRSSGSVAVDWALGLQVDHAARARSFSYLTGSIAYIIVPLLLFAALRPTRTALADTLRPTEANRTLVAMAFWLPLLLPALLNLFFPTRLTSIWTIPNWTLFPVVLLGSRHLVVSRHVTVVALGLAMLIPVLALAAAPAVAIAAHGKTNRLFQSHFRLLGEAAQQRWHDATDAPLRLLGGDDALAFGAAYYAADRPIVVARSTPDSVAAARIDREGIVMLCTADDTACLAYLDAAGSGRTMQRDEITLARTYLGRPGLSQRYVILAIPPR